MRGVIGAWGWVLAAGGGVCARGGSVAWGQALGRARAAGWGAYGRMGRATRALARSIPVLGGVLTLFAAWLVVQLLLTYRALQANPMLVPRLGPGLFVALVGGLVMVAPPLVRALRRRGRAIAQRP